MSRVLLKKGSYVKETVTRSIRTDIQTTHTEVLIPEYPIRASAFQASAYDMRGPIYMCHKMARKVIKTVGVTMLKNTGK